MQLDTNLYFNSSGFIQQIKPKSIHLTPLTINPFTENKNHKLNDNLLLILNDNSNSSFLNQSQQNKSINDDKEKIILREKNKNAARKWRKAQNEYIEMLDSENEMLRKQLLQMLNDMKKLKIENNILNDQILFFQSIICVSKKI